MSLFIDEKYARLAGMRLNLFTEGSNHTFSFRCNICGDSKKKKHKKRGGFFHRAGKLYFSCFNCGASMSFSSWLNNFDYNLYQQYALEKFYDRQDKILSNEILKVPQTKKYIPNIFSGLEEVKNLNPDNTCRKFAEKRKLPINDFELYYAPRFIEWANGNTDKFKNWKGDDHPRMIIAWRDRDGHIIGYSARDIVGNQEQKYYRIFVDETKEHYYGLYKLNNMEQVYVLEGEIDSMFLPNAIAVANGKLSVYQNPNAIYIPDADTRNPHVMKGVKKLITDNYKVCLLPDDLPGKDINELILAGFYKDKILDIINNNTYQGLTAMLKFSTWSKVNDKVK